MFLERKEKYKTLNLIASSLFIGALVTLFCLMLYTLLGFDGKLHGYIDWAIGVFFISGLIVEVIPDFLEKDKKKALFKSIMIVCIAIIWLIL